MKISDTQAHVCIDRDEVSVGDTVSLFRNECRTRPDTSPKSPSRTKTECGKNFVAKGTVVELLNEHYAIANFPSGTDFREGDVVERGRS